MSRLNILLKYSKGLTIAFFSMGLYHNFDVLYSIEKVS